MKTAARRAESPIQALPCALNMMLFLTLGTEV